MLEIQKMDEFIKKYSNVYLNNPEKLIDSREIYSGLQNYGVIDQEINSSIDEQLVSLENNFKNSNFLQVYFDGRQSNFLQFSHSANDENFVKLYLNVSKEYIGYVSQKIFDFINSKKIDTLSKVSNKVRSDDIVIRLTNEKDAREVINYINNESSLSSLVSSTNPFMLKEGVVGVAWDGKISYNSVVAMLLAKYFDELKSIDYLSMASISDFSKFLNQFHKNVFQNHSQLIEFFEDYSFQDNLKYFDGAGDALTNYDRIIKLITNVCSNKMTLDNYFEFYNNCTEKKLKEKSSMYDAVVEYSYNCEPEFKK